jgi:hypothetical protein
MAATYSPNDALTHCKIMVKNMKLQEIRAQILDDTLKMLWHAAPWRWTVAAFPDVTVTANTQDYVVAIPDDFLYMQEAKLVDGTSGADSSRELDIEPFEIAGGLKGQPSSISITGTPGENGTLRTYPIQGTISAGRTPKILSIYKKSAPKITEATYNTAGFQVFDDDWFWVYVSGVLYMAYLYADDARAGVATINGKGDYQFTGQRAVFESNLILMQQREKLSPVGTGRLLQEVKQK